MTRSVLTALLLSSALVLLPDLAHATGHGFGRLHRDRLEIGRALLEVQSTNWTSVLPYYADDVEYHDPIVDIHGIDAMAAFLGGLFASTPDLVTTVDKETLIGDVYTATWTMTGQFSGVPYSTKGISILRFRERERQVVYQRDYYTEGDIMANIPELAPVIEGFRTFYRCAVDPTFDCPLPPPDVPTGPMLASPSRQAFLPPVDRGNGGRSWLRLRRDRLAIARAVVEINASNWTDVLPWYADDVVYSDPIVEIQGRETMTAFLGRLFTSAPDLVTTVEEETLVDGVYMATWTMAGRFAGVPYSAKGMSIVVFRDRERQVAYARDYYTEGDVMANIPELAPAVTGFRTFYRCAVDPTFDCPLPPPEGLARGGGASTEIRERPGASRPALGQNAPNPFNPATTISFELPAGGADVSLRIYDVSGRLVRTLVHGHGPAGSSSVTWNGEDDQGRRVASGIYFYELRTPSFSDVKKMILIE